LVWHSTDFVPALVLGVRIGPDKPILVIYFLLGIEYCKLGIISRGLQLKWLLDDAMFM
jgi:hypothetical protein